VAVCPWPEQSSFSGVAWEGRRWVVACVAQVCLKREWRPWDWMQWCSCSQGVGWAGLGEVGVAVEERRAGAG
jgi:hypothetical protein